MGNCASVVNCTLTNQPIKSDPDVAGIGVLVAFIATVIITFMTIIIGYLTDSLPDSTLTELDRALIAKIRWRPRECETRLWTLLQHPVDKITTFILPNHPMPHSNPEPDEKRKWDRARRSKGLERFLLALSDQQLVTGLAILIAGYTNRCSRSLYHFDIIAALGWFSSTTHLSTLAVLRAYMVDHPRVRDWRAIVMLGVFGLLAVSQIVSYSTQSNTLPVQCAFKSFAPNGLYFLNIIELAIVIIFLAISYTDRIRRLYTFDPDWNIQDYIFEILARRVFKTVDLPNVEGTGIASSPQSKAKQGVTYRNRQQRRRWENFCKNWAKLRPGLRRRMVEIIYLFEELQRSFLSEILTLLFGVSYGVAQVITNRKDTPTAGISGDQNAMTFGQLVPLLLIALPVLAAGEVYFERHDEVGNAPSPVNTVVGQLDPATLLIQDDTDDAVRVTLRMMGDSESSLSRNSAVPSGHVMNHQSAVPSPDANSDIELVEMHSTTREERPDATRAATSRRREGLTTTGSATNAAATAVEDDPTASHADVESGSPQMPKAKKCNKVRILMFMFFLQACFNVFFGVILAGVGAKFLLGIPAIISLIGSLIAVLLFIRNLGLQIKEGWVSKGA